MCMIIDTHNHLWRCQGEHFAWIAEDSVIRRDFLLNDLKQTLGAAGVTGSILVQAVPTPEETLWLLEIAAEDPLIKGVVGWADVADGGGAVERALAAYAKKSVKLKGIRYMSQGLPPEHLLETRFAEGVRAVGEHGLAYELLIVASQLEAARTVVERCPKVRFAIEHIAKPDIRNRVVDPWQRGLSGLAADHDNVVCKLSGMVTEADWERWSAADIEPYMHVAFEAFGPDRVMFGSDWPVALLAADYGRVLGLCAAHVAGKPEAEREKFFALNAQRFYGLDS